MLVMWANGKDEIKELIQSLINRRIGGGFFFFLLTEFNKSLH